jgi:hypothetical protein
METMMTPDDNDRKALEHLNEALVQDILETSDDDILAEAKEDGADPEAIAAASRALFEASVAAGKKARLAAAKVAAAADRGQRVPSVPIDPTEARRLLERVLARQDGLTAAARKARGGALSDDEVYGLLQDFRDVGISVDDHSGNDK